MTPDDQYYYRNRLAEERERAADATCAATAHIHARMADLYEKMLDQPDAPRPTMRRKN